MLQLAHLTIAQIYTWCYRTTDNNITTVGPVSSMQCYSWPYNIYIQFIHYSWACPNWYFVTVWHNNLFITIILLTIGTTSWACLNYVVLQLGMYNTTTLQQYNTTVGPVPTIWCCSWPYNTTTIQHYSWACPNYSVAVGPTTLQQYNTTVGPVPTIVLQLALQHYNNTTLQLGLSQLYSVAVGPTTL